jgi:hypothetical protein
VTLARLVRWSGPACLAAGVLAVATVVLFAVVVGSGTISQAATSPAFHAPTVAALGSPVLLLVGLVGLFIRQAGELGTLGLVGFLTGLVGTALAAGWLLFAVASLRTRVFPRWAVVLLIVGAVVVLLPTPSRTLLLGVAVACLGVRLVRPARAADPALTSETA